VELTGLILQASGPTGQQVAEIIIGSLAVVMAAYIAITIFWQRRQEKRTV
jgi:hypothetical protein